MNNIVSAYSVRSGNLNLFALLFQHPTGVGGQTMQDVESQDWTDGSSHQYPGASLMSKFFASLFGILLQLSEAQKYGRSLVVQRPSFVNVRVDGLLVDANIHTVRTFLLQAHIKLPHSKMLLVKVP